MMNGPQYQNNLIKGLTESLGMQQTFTAPYTPQHNGMVERLNAEVTKHVRLLMASLGEREDWARLLPMVQFILNNSSHRALGTTPYAMLHGDHVVPERGIPRTLDTVTPRRCTAPAYARELKDHVKAIRTAAKTVQQEDIRWHERYIPEKKDSFSPGDLVLVTRPKDRPSKLAPLHNGPFRVVSWNNHFYQLSSLVDDGHFTVHEARPIRYSGTDVDEARRLAAQDADEYVVHSVTDHKVVDDVLMLRLHWDGYPESADTWQPVDEDVEGTAAVDAYLDAHELRSLL